MPETNIALPDHLLTRNWYLLWAPKGLGGTTARIKDAQSVLQICDPWAVVWYPLKAEGESGDTKMVPFYSGYILVQCIWSPAMEVQVREAMPVYLEFIKDCDTMLPIRIPDDQVDAAQEFIKAELKNPDRTCVFKVGDQVRVLKKSLLGFVGPVLATPSPDKVLVELPWFNRPTPTLVDVDDLELV